MTMLHDTFCTPSTYDKHHNIINETTCTKNHTLRVDTLFQSSNNNKINTILPPPPSLRSSNSSLTTASSTSSNDDTPITNEDHHKLISWVQRQLGFYTTLSILPPRISCIDDGKLLLCLIHRFAPDYLPNLVITLEQHTTAECLVLADNLAQKLWHTSIDSLAIYLHQHYHNTSQILGDYMDSISLSGPDDENDDDDDENHHVQPSAAIIQMDDDNTQYYTKWISATHQSIDSYLHHPHTHRLSVLLSLVDQLAGIYIDFTRLTTTAASVPTPDYLLPTHQLLGRLQLIDTRLATLTTHDYDDDDDDDEHNHLSDLLVQRHVCLQTGVQQALELFEKTNDVQTRVTAFTNDKDKNKAAWLAALRRYRHEDQDVLALMAYASSSDTTVVARVTKPTVIKTLDRLDTVMAQSTQVAQQLHRYSVAAADWDRKYKVALTGLQEWHGSIQQLTQQVKWNCDISHRSLVQQWKILAARLGRLEHGDYATAVYLYRILATEIKSLPMVAAVEMDKDYDMLVKHWKRLPGALEMARHRIAQYKRIKDFLHRCYLVQINATELERQLGANPTNLYDKPWMEDQVDELDQAISGVLGLADNLGGDEGDDGFVQQWKNVLMQCQLDYHQAWAVYQCAWIRLERQYELDDIKHTLDEQLDSLQQSTNLFDPWTCGDGVGDMEQMKQGYVERKRHFMNRVVTRFDQWVKKDGGGGDASGVDDVRATIEKGQHLLMDYCQRMDILEKRHAWEHQWHNTSMEIQQATNMVYALLDSDGGNSSNTTRMEEYKPDLGQLRQAWDDLLALDSNHGHMLATSVVMDRMYQRQQLLGDQVNELDELLDSTHGVLVQTAQVGTYMTSVDALLETSQSLGRGLESVLLSSPGVGTVDQQEKKIEALAVSAVQLWQGSVTPIHYGNSFLVVDDLVRWKVLMAYGNLMSAMVRLVVDGMDAYTKRTEWEQQWQLDMDGLKQAKQHLSWWIQQQQQQQLGQKTYDMVDGTMDIVEKYTKYSFYRLEQCFTDMQHAYPVNLKFPLALKEQQQQLTADVSGQVKSLCALVTYLYTASQLNDICDDMNATLDQDGANASGDQVQQWMAKIKVDVEQELFASLCDQQVRLQDGVQFFGKENVQLVRGNAKTVLADLQSRLVAVLNTSQHTRLVKAYGQSATFLESTLRQLQDDLVCTTNEHGKLVPGGDMCQECKMKPCVCSESLSIKWKEAKLALETVHTGSYNDIQSLCQLIQLQQEDSDVVARQSLLDDLWHAVWQDLKNMHDRILSLAQWRDLSSSLDKVQGMLTPLDQWMDKATMAVRDKDVINDLSRKYQETHATLAVVRDSIMRSGEQTKAALMHRWDDLCGVVDGLHTALACFAHQWCMDERTVVLDRLVSWMGMPLFDYDGIQTLVVKSWDAVNNKAETSKTIYDKVVALLALCESKTVLNNGKGDNGDALLVVCQESVNALSKMVEMEQHCLKGLLAEAFEYGQQVPTLFLGLDRLGKDLTDFVFHGTTNDLVDWQLDIHVWRYKVAHYEKMELRAFLDKLNERLLLVSTGDANDDDLMKALGDHAQRCMQDLVKEVESRWDGIKAQLDNAASEVTAWQLKKVAERQWQDLLDSIENACNRTTVVVSGFYHDSDPVMLSQEQDLLEARQALTILAYETRPVLALKAKQVKTALDALTSTWIDHGDVDRVLDGWEQALQQHQQHLHHNISMCQYWVAAAEVQGNLCVLEQLLDNGDKTKFKVYMDALDTNLEKTRQAATLLEGSGRTEYALLVSKRNKLERQFNTHQRWLVTPTGGNGGGGLHRSRKISLPSRMPSQNLMARTPNAYVADPQNDLDMEIGRIVNKVPYKVELNMVPGEAGRYRFGSKLVYCRILKSRMVMVRVGGGWTELSQFLRDHALLVGSKSPTTTTTMTTTTTTADGYQEMYLDTKRATSPSGRPLLLPRMSQSTTTTSTASLSISGNAGYKDGDRYIAVDLQGYQHEMRMTPHDNHNTGRRYS